MTPREEIQQRRDEAHRQYYQEPHDTEYSTGLRWGVLWALDWVLMMLPETPGPLQAHSKSQYKRLKAQGAEVLPPTTERSK